MPEFEHSQRITIVVPSCQLGDPPSGSPKSQVPQIRPLADIVHSKDSLTYLAYLLIQMVPCKRFVHAGLTREVKVRLQPFAKMAHATASCITCLQCEAIIIS